MTDVRRNDSQEVPERELHQQRALPEQEVEEEIITEENVFDRPDETMGFFPGQVLKDGYVAAALLIVCVALSYIYPAPLSAPADPAATDYVPRPEWFLFFYEQILMFFPGYILIQFGAVIVPAVFVILLFALPWLDTSPHYSPLKRPFATVVGILIIVVVVLNMLLAVSRVINFPTG